MSYSPKLTRRAAMAGAAALPFIGQAAQAASPMLGASTAQFQRVKFGDFEITNILAGTRVFPDPHTIFGLNTDAETFEKVSKAANLPLDAAQFFFTPTVVNTGAELVLFDTGLAADATTAALKAAGYTPDQIDVVIITHMHGDHIGGLQSNGSPTYPNARYYTAAAEFDHWAAAGNEGFDGNVRPLAEKFTMLKDGGSVVSGITAMDAAGHTPGHMAYMIESNGAQLVVTGDLANHYVWSIAHPEWEVRFDMDKAVAAQARKRILGMLAADKVPFIGYHMPWPAMGFIEQKDSGFVYAPHSYQLTIG